MSFIPNYVSAGSTIGIGNEQLTVLNVFNDSNVLRVERGDSTISHAESSFVNYTQKSFIINDEVPYFESKNKDKVFFNASESVGIGTTFGRDSLHHLYLENQQFQEKYQLKEYI